ncbi:TPA: hypothetical protein I9089_002430 [Clostridium perfringens]|nr:hypothetical protein [Clostridium perfringens]
MKIGSIYNYKSIGCSCRDGKSYPEKFMRSLLEQLNVDFEIEYSPSWIDNKRYDFYIKECNCIIEVHGKQHYDGSFKVKGGRTLEEEKQNDKHKKEVALLNGIKYYIELDCRESNMDYIKNSIINSELANLFDLSNINWTSCAKFSNKNIVKEVCDHWNNRSGDEMVGDLAKIFNLDRCTINRYLKKGTKLGWCEYDPRKEKIKSALKNSSLCKKKVEIFKDNQSLGVFESYKELAKQSEELFGVKLLSQNISSVCAGRLDSYKGFAFKHIL